MPQILMATGTMLPMIGPLTMKTAIKTARKFTYGLNAAFADLSQPASWRSTRKWQRWASFYQGPYFTSHPNRNYRLHSKYRKDFHFAFLRSWFPFLKTLFQRKLTFPNKNVHSFFADFQCYFIFYGFMAPVPAHSFKRFQGFFSNFSMILTYSFRFFLLYLKASHVSFFSLPFLLWYFEFFS